MKKTHSVEKSSFGSLTFYKHCNTDIIAVQFIVLQLFFFPINVVLDVFTCDSDYDENLKLWKDHTRKYMRTTHGWNVQCFTLKNYTFWHFFKQTKNGEFILVI